MFTTLPFEGLPAPRAFSSIDEALTTIAAHLRQRSSAAHKERIDLTALHAHTGERFAQHVLIPDELHARLRELHGVVPVVLLPPGAGGSSVAGADAVVLFMDAHASLKGLPPNKRATMLLSACGLSARGEVCGDCFIGRLRHDLSAPAEKQLAFGGEFAPQMIVERDWLEAAQAVHKAATGSPTPLESTLAARFAGMRRREVVAATTGAAGTGAAATAASPSSASPAAPAQGAVTTPTPPPPPPTAAAADSASKVATGTEGGAVKTVAGADSIGGGDTLSWADEGKEVSVRIRVPAGTKAKHVHCTFKEQWLRVEVLTLAESERLVVDGKLFQEVEPGDCTWCVEDGGASDGGQRVLSLSLEKKTEMRWLMLTRTD